MRAIGLSLAVLVGLLLGQQSQLAPPVCLLAALVGALATLLAWWVPLVRWAAIGLLVVGLCATRAAASVGPTSDDLTPYIGQTLSLEGVVASAPAQSPRSVRFVLQVDHLLAIGRQATDRAVQARVQLVDLPTGAAERAVPGDRLTVNGKVVAPRATAGFDAAASLRRQGIFEELSFPRVQVSATEDLSLSTLAPAVRTAIAAGFQRYLPEPQASLASGLLLGGSGQLDADFRDALQASGLAHFVAIDGFKLALIAGLLWSATGWLGRRWASVVVLLGVVAYVLLAGAPASAVRAALMLGAAILARLVGRVADPLTSLLLAASAMALVQPAILEDAGFQLSVSATLGLVLLQPRIGGWLPARLPRWIVDPVSTTLAVSLATLPVTLSVFRQVSLISPLAHVVATPVAAVLLVADMLFAASLPPPLPVLAPLAAGVVWLPATALVAITRLAAQGPVASINLGQLPAPAAFAVAGLMLAWAVWPLPEVTALRAHLAAAVPGVPWRARAAALVGTALAAALLVAAGLQPDHLLHVTVLSTARGQAELVRGPTGTTLLVAGAGLEPRGLASLVSDHLDAWERSLGGVLLLDAADQPGVAEVLQRYPPAMHLTADQDQRLDLGGGLVVDVYASTGQPGVALSYGDVWLRLAGDPPVPLAVDSPPLLSLIGPTPPSVSTLIPDVWVGGPKALANQTTVLPDPQEGGLELESDGDALWPAAS